MIVAAFFQRRHFHFDGVNLWGDRSVADGANGQFPISMHGGNLFVFEVDDVFGVRHNGCGVRTHEEFVVLAHSDDEGR